MRVHTSLLRKVGDFKELEEESHWEDAVWVKVEETLTLSNKDFNLFIKDFMADRPYLEGKGVVLVVNEKDNSSVVVDTQGYIYARYVGLVYAINKSEIEEETK